MSTSVRARHGAGGFSFVELLVTIVIAGIVFVAMVPVFVSATQKGAGDTARNVSLSLAQDRIEKIRQLDYDLLTEANFGSTTFSGGGFGPTATVSGGSNTKPYQVAYSVTFVGGTYTGQHVVNYSSGNKSETYKLVTVDVSWTGNPKPVKHAVLTTIVYKQYAGSYINVFSVSPISNLWPAGSPLSGPIDPNDVHRLFITGYSITLTAYVNDADALNTKNVTFTVFNSSGAQVDKLVRATTDPGYTSGTFVQTYVIVGPPGSQDDTYTFKAIAISKRGYEGNTQVITMPVETGAPPAPTGVAASPGNGQIDLTWNQSATGDVVKYEVYREGPTGVFSWIADVPVTTNQLPGYPDKNLTNGLTYSYKVLAVDGVRNEGLLSVAASATPFVPIDDVPPNPVASGSAAATGTQAPPLKIRITWWGVTDQTSPPKPTSGMDKYLVYRSDDGVNYPASSSYSVADTGAGAVLYSIDDGSDLKPLHAYYYKIVAVDRAGNLATSALIMSATTLNYQYCKVTVYNSSTLVGANLEVTNPNGTLLDTWPSGQTNPTNPTHVQKKKGADWYLPVGFSFLAWWTLDGTTTKQQKPIPATGNIVSTSPITISFP